MLIDFDLDGKYIDLSQYEGQLVVSIGSQKHWEHKFIELPNGGVWLKGDHEFILCEKLPTDDHNRDECYLIAPEIKNNKTEFYYLIHSYRAGISLPYVRSTILVLDNIENNIWELRSEHFTMYGLKI